MLPIQRKKQNFVPAFREWIIDILMRAFQNLMINALVHGGEETAIEIQITKTEGKIELMMSDNGKGMTEEETKRLFERYYRGANTEKKIEGTGLGMAITKSIIELHNGRIRVRSRLQVGTTFFIDFPVN